MDHIIGYQYSTEFSGTFSSADKDLLFITIPANPADPYAKRKRSLLLRRVVVATATDETDSNAVIAIERCTNAVAGTDLAFSSINGGPAFIAGLGGGGEGAPGSNTTKDLHYCAEPGELSIGWVWDRCDHEEIRVPPGKGLALRLVTAITSATLFISVEFDMVP